MSTLVEYAITMPGDWYAQYGMWGKGVKKTHARVDEFKRLGGESLRVSPAWRFGMSGNDVTIQATGTQAAIDFIANDLTA